MLSVVSDFDVQKIWPNVWTIWKLYFTFILPAGKDQYYYLFILSLMIFMSFYISIVCEIILYYYLNFFIHILSFCQVHFIIVSFCVLCVCSLYVVYSSYFYFFIFVAIFMRWTCYCYLFLTILLILTKLQCPDFCFINCDYKDVSDIFFITQLINFSHSNYSFTFIFSPFLPLTSPPPFYFLLSLQKRAVLSSISVSHSLSSCNKTSHLLS